MRHCPGPFLNFSFAHWPREHPFDWLIAPSSQRHSETHLKMPGPGHNGGKVAYIDTENTFRPNRIRPIAERFDLDPDLVLGNIGSDSLNDQVNFERRTG